MKKFNLFSIILFTTVFLLLNFKTVRADSGCNGQYGQYGGCPPSQTILIDKMVGKPIQTKGSVTDYEYVDNLSASDPRYKATQAIFFRIKVKNTANIKLVNVTVKDFVPLYLQPIEGPGSYDNLSRIITFNAGDFSPDEEKVYYVKMQVVDQNLLPADKGLFCLVNKVQAYTDKASDDDSSQFCIEKQVLGAAKVPSAGPELGTILLAGEIITLGIGVSIRKYLT